MTQQPLSNSGGVGEGKPSHSQDIEKILDYFHLNALDLTGTTYERVRAEAKTAIESLVNEARIDELRWVQNTYIADKKMINYNINQRHKKYYRELQAEAKPKPTKGKK